MFINYQKVHSHLFDFHCECESGEKSRLYFPLEEEATAQSTTQKANSERARKIKVKQITKIIDYK